MSGGSWDHVYEKFRETGWRLSREPNMLRVALGLHLIEIADALRAIEWNDSGDGDSTEGERLRKVVPPSCAVEDVQRRIDNLRRDLDELSKMVRSPEESLDYVLRHPDAFKGGA